MQSYALDGAYSYVGVFAAASFLLLAISGWDLFEKGGPYTRSLAIVVGVSFISIPAIDGIVKAEARVEIRPR